ncbi:PTS system N-acetylglucosamine-specific EIIBC component [Candidatus Hepatincolaceae symbiont of Richtersius coronifer]
MNLLQGSGRFFIKLGKALMLPIAVLPIAGILLRVGQGDVLDIKFIAEAGNSIFANLPIIFALGVAIGFSNDNHGSVALAAFVAHAIFIAALKVLIPEANMGVVSGIIIGIITGTLYNRYKNIELPSYLSFFGGRRFIPIIAGLAALFLAIIAKFVWPPVELLINLLGNWIITANNVGLFVYGFTNRMLLPTGLHHILNSLVWFQFGDFKTIVNGAEVVTRGDLWRFFSGDKTAGAFMSLFFPIMMFGLPGAALAMIVTAKPEKRKLISGILISAALTAFLTGITEPLEFSFLFLAFPLFILHAVLTGISAVIMNMLDIKLGFTFSAGLFDYILSYNLGNKAIWLLPVGAFYFVLYFIIFYFSIKFWNIKTPGREDDDFPTTIKAAKGKTFLNKEEESAQPNLGLQYISALGGIDNIKNIDNCVTRLRVEIVDNNKIKDISLKQLGAKGVIKNIKGSVQIVIGPEVEQIAEQIKKTMKTLY